jgi:hypothetical protein
VLQHYNLYINQPNRAVYLPLDQCVALSSTYWQHVQFFLQKQFTAFVCSSICCKMTCSVGSCIRASNRISLAFYINFLADYGLCGTSQLMISCFSDARVKASFIGTLFYPALSTVKMLLGLRFEIICFSAAVTEFT